MARKVLTGKGCIFTRDALEYTKSYKDGKDRGINVLAVWLKSFKHRSEELSWL